jgi:hypothetical protein
VPPPPISCIDKEEEEEKEGEEGKERERKRKKKLSPPVTHPENPPLPDTKSMFESG